MTINCFLAFILFEIEFLLTLTFILAVVTSGTILYSYLKKKNKLKDTKSFFLLVIDQLKRIATLILSMDISRLIQKYLIINKKYILTSLLGLTLSMFIISQSILLVNSYEKDAFDKHFETADKMALEITLNGLGAEGDFQMWTGLTSNEMYDIVRKYNFRVTEIDTRGYLTLRIASGGIYGQLDGTVYHMNLETETIEWNQEMFDILYEFPSFDKSLSYNPDETFLIIPTSSYARNWIFDYNPDNYIERQAIVVIADEIRKWPGQEFTYMALPFTHIWSPSVADFTHLKENELEDRLDFVMGQYLTSNTNMWRIYYEFLEIKPVNVVNSELLTGSTQLYLELPDIVNENIDHYMANLVNLELDMQSWIYSLVDTDRVDMISPLYQSFEEFQKKANSFKQRIALAVGPLVGISIYFIYFSIAMGEKRKTKLNLIMKLRGTSKEQLRSMFIFETIVSSIIASLLGMILSLPGTTLSLRMSGYFEFKGENIELSIPNSWFWQVPVIGLILALNLNIASILKHSKRGMEDVQDTDEHTQPFWVKIHLDLILFGLSSIYWMVIYFVTFDDEEVYKIVLNVVGPIMLVIAFLSSTLLFSRYFADFISILSRILWKVQGGFTALATYNMKKNKFNTSRLATLLLMSIILSMIAITVSLSYINFEKDNAKYQVGADIHIEGIDLDNFEHANLIDVDGVEDYTSVGKVQTYMYDRGKIQKISILGIEPEKFKKVAYWDKAYASEELDSMMSKLKLANQGINSINVGIQEKVMQTMRLRVGENFKINFADESHSEFTTSIISKFEYFPNLVDELPRKDQYGDYIFGEIPILVNLVKLEAMNIDIVSGAYIKIREDYQPEDVIREIRYNFSNDTNVKINSIYELEKEILESIEAKVFISVLHSMLIITSIVSFIAIIYFSFITLAERKHEIGIFRAIGMVRLQIFRLLVFESLIILFSALFFGALIGLFLSYNLFYLIVGNNLAYSIPPINAVIPWKVVGNYAIIFTVISIISAAAPAKSMSSKSTGNILRVE
ncbi:MAG: FtsX-like permease family protein [Candidatus Kariarchaeaceae archaeon]